MELFDKEWSLIGAMQGTLIGIILVLASPFASLKQPILRVIGCLGLFLVVGTGVFWYYAGFWTVVITFIILGILIGYAVSSGMVRRSRYGRVTHCYSCKSGLDGSTHSTCWNCKWIRCPNCGACGCGFRKQW